MKDGASVPLERTATPVELDSVYGALSDLSASLGPNGANKNGALSDLVDVGAANLKGNGEALNHTLTGFSRAVETLAKHRDDLFSSLDNLQVFTSALASIDAQVGQFNANLAATSQTAGGGAQGSGRRHRPAVQGAGRRRRVRPHQHHAADQQRQQAGRRHAGARPAAHGPGRGARRGSGGAGEPVPRLQPGLRHARHPRQLGRLDQPRGHRLPGAGRGGPGHGRPTSRCRSVPPVPLPTTPESICARLLSGDANADRRPTTSTTTASPICRNWWARSRRRWPVAPERLAGRPAQRHGGQLMSRRPARFLALLLGTLLLAGCGFRGAYSFNLPGGADTGDHPYTVKVHSSTSSTSFRSPASGCATSPSGASRTSSSARTGPRWSPSR